MPQNQKNSVQKIEYPKLNKIGGFWNFVTRTLIHILVIVLISGALGFLAGRFAQDKFSDLTGYNKGEVVAAVGESEITERAKIDQNTEGIKNVGILQDVTDTTVNLIISSLNATNSAIVALNESELLQKTNEITKGVITKALRPVNDVLEGLLKFLYLAAFWTPFCVIFLITAWLTDKLLFAKKYLLTNGVDPLVIKNMEALHAKVNELVDRANQSIIT